MAWRDQTLRFPQEDNPVLKTLDKEKRDSTILYFIRWGDGAHFDKNPFRILWFKFLFNPAISLSDIKPFMDGTFMDV
jgi:hypothetical protein